MSTTTRGYEFRQLPSHAELVLKPEINDVAWDNIEQAGNEMVASLESSGKTNLIVDLSPISYVGSSTVALLVRCWKTVKRLGGQLVVVNRDENVYGVFKLASLTDQWPFVESREEALELIGVSRGLGSDSGSNALSWVLVVVGVIGLAVGAAGAVFRFQGDAAPLPAQQSQIAVVVGSILALLCGGLIIWRERRGGVKAIGGLLGLLGLAVLVTGLIAS